MHSHSNRAHTDRLNERKTKIVRRKNYIKCDQTVVQFAWLPYCMAERPTNYAF